MIYRTAARVMRFGRSERKFENRKSKFESRKGKGRFYSRVFSQFLKAESESEI